MKVTFHKERVRIEREDGDRRMKNTSQLLYALRDWMNENGFEYGQFIKKLMYKDGHLTDDDRHYVRARKPDMVSLGFVWAVHDGRHQIGDAGVEFNRDGVVELTVERVG